MSLKLFTERTETRMTERELYKNLCNENYIDKQQVLKNVISTQTVLNKQNKGRFNMKKRIAVLASAAIIVLSSFTVFAVSKYLTPAQTAELLDQPFVAEAFKRDDAKIVNESATDGKYLISFLGIAKGESLVAENVQSDKTYAVIAISNTDGSKMTKSIDEQFFVSPLVSGLNPILYNIATMNGSYTEKFADGILYRLIKCDNIEMFANRELYLCVNDGSFFNSQGYVYDEASGKITVNESYDGVNVLFNLPISKENADDSKVEDFIYNVENKKDDTEDSNEVNQILDNQDYIFDNGLLDLKTLKEKSSFFEGSLSTLSLDSNNSIYYSYNNDELGSGSGSYPLPQKYAVGESFLIGKIVNTNETEISVRYETGTMLENGKIEFAVYIETLPINK